MYGKSQPAESSQIVRRACASVDSQRSFRQAHGRLTSAAQIAIPATTIAPIAAFSSNSPTPSANVAPIIAAGNSSRGTRSNECRVLQIPNWSTTATTTKTKCIPSTGASPASSQSRSTRRGANGASASVASHRLVRPSRWRDSVTGCSLALMRTISCVLALLTGSSPLACNLVCQLWVLRKFTAPADTARIAGLQPLI